MAKKQPKDKTSGAALVESPADIVEVSEDEQFVAQSATHVLAFLKRLGEFFTIARALEASAVATLDAARGLQPSTNADEDVKVQQFIKKTSADAKDVADHWSITTVIHGFHRRMTGRRAVAEGKLKEANAIGNALHNRYVDEQQRKAAEAQEQERRAAETRARLDREREQAEREAAALQAESEAPDLSQREAMFVDYVIAGMVPSKAAQRAGYKNPEATAEKILALPKIMAALDAKKRAEVIREQAAAEAQKPLDIQVETVRPEIDRAVGARDRTTHSAEVVDAQALIQACIAGGYGIPWDILDVKPAKVNEYARSLHEQINRWPGVRYKKTTSVV